MSALIRTLSASLAAAAILAVSPVANALTLVSSTLNGNTIDASFSTPELAAVDIDFLGAGSVSLVFEVSAEDVTRGFAGFNSIVGNVSGDALGVLSLGVDRGTLTAGDVVSNDGAVLPAAVDARSVTLTFSPPMTTQAYLGDALLTGTAADWTIGLGSLSAGDNVTLTVTAAIPEPAPVALALAGLALLALHRRTAR